MTRALVALCGALTLLCAGCGGGDGEAVATETGWSPYGPVVPVRVYFLLEGKVWPVGRAVDATEELPNAAYQALLRGPTQEEREIGLTTEVPEDENEDPSDAALAQMVYTATQFSSDDSAEFNGVNFTRADFEDFTPAILVESPLAFEEVGSPLRVSGTANTFEANFQYTLTDTDGLIVDENFVTATSGTGTRGTFEFETKPYTVPFDGVGALIVFESSAKDGSKINLVEIPLRMRR